MERATSDGNDANNGSPFIHMHIGLAVGSIGRYSQESGNVWAEVEIELDYSYLPWLFSSV